MRAFGLARRDVDVPPDWQRLQLKHVLSFCNRGVAPTYADGDSEAVAVSQKCVGEGRVDPTVGRGMILDQDPGEATIRGGDVLVNSTGRGTLGRAGLVSDDGLPAGSVYVADGHVTVLRPDVKKIEPRYLAHLLVSR